VKIAGARDGAGARSDESACEPRDVDAESRDEGSAGDPSSPGETKLLE